MTDRIVNGWTFRKEISFGDLIKSLIIVAALVAWGATVETRFERQEGSNNVFLEKIVNIEERQTRTENRISKKIDDMRMELRTEFNSLRKQIREKQDK